jgi:glycosyltransferase involved in cell wall biosynthesis
LRDERQTKAIQVSVVVPLFDKSRWVERAIRSITTQARSTYVNIYEIIVVDDGSTDDGGELVEALGIPHVRVYRQANAGVSAARNRGVELSRGSWVAFLDADDEWRPGHAQACGEAISRFPEADLVFTHYGHRQSPTSVDHSSKRHPLLIEDYFDYAIRHMGACSSAIWVRKAIIPAGGVFPLGVHRGEDLTAWHRLVCRPAVCVVIPYTLVSIDTDASDSYRHSLAARGSSIDWYFLHDARRNREAGLVPPHLVSSYERYVDRLVARYCVELAQQGNRTLAASSLLRYYRGGFLDVQFLRFVGAFLAPSFVYRLGSLLLRHMRSWCS